MPDTLAAPTPDTTPALVAEFVGTFFLTLTVGCNVLAENGVWSTTSIGLALMVLVYAFGDVSGANLNPAVSLALGMTKKMPWGKVGAYIGMQVLGALCASFAYRGMFAHMFNIGPHPGFGLWQVGAVEALFTCMLCFVVLNCAASKFNNPKSEPNSFYGLAIGLVIVAGGTAAGHVSGGALNPAVALAIDLSSTGIGFGWGPKYMLFEILGAVIAAVIYRLVRPDDFDERYFVNGTGFYGIRPRLVAEFIGTFYLVFTVGLTVLGNSGATPWAAGACLTCFVYSLGNVSGGHFNPAVTIAVHISGREKLRGPNAWYLYILSQAAAAICAALLYSWVHNWTAFPVKPVGASLGPLAAMEILFTCLLCFVVLSVATVARPLSDAFGLAIGLCVAVAGFAGGALGAGVLNPAVALGAGSIASLVHTDGKIQNCLMFILLELVGALFAAALFRQTRPSEFESTLVK